MNLSAPFIPQFFKSQVDEMMPYVDVLIGNESEAEAYAASHDWNVSSLARIDAAFMRRFVYPYERSRLQTKDIATIATKLAELPKKNSSTPRLVIITQGASSTIVASNSPAALGLSESPKVYAVGKLESSQIVDTNGAGDAFAGGFLGARGLGKSVDEAVEVGHKMGAMCVQCSGPTFRFPKENVL